MGTSLKRKEFAPRGSEFFPLRAVPYGVENHFYHITRVTSLECYYFFTHVLNCVMGAMPMKSLLWDSLKSNSNSLIGRSYHKLANSMVLRPTHRSRCGVVDYPFAS